MKSKFLTSAAFALAIGLTPAFATSALAEDTTKAENVTESSPAAATSEAAETRSIVEVAAATGEFTTLLAAAEAAGLTEALAAQGPLTIFAPTDAAFEALPEGELQRLLQPENVEELRAILTYHVVPGLITAETVSGRQGEAGTANGATLAIDARDGVRVNDATVVRTDVLASNGVIHVIDKVLIPPVATPEAADAPATDEAPSMEDAPTN
jgi:uncharacterized surface protein with fasciclin (FAS1) repeats